VQYKTLAQKYTDEKLAQLVASRKANGSWLKDDDFPDDPTEEWFLMHDTRSYSVDNNATESIGGSSKVMVEGEAAASLMGDGGLLSAAGMQVSLQGTSDKEQLSLLDQVHKGLAIVKEPEAPEKKKRAKAGDANPNADGTPQVKVVSELAKAQGKLADMLTKAKEARSLHTQLDGMGLSSEIANNMIKYATMMEYRYKQMRDLTVGTTDETFLKNIEDYKKHLKDTCNFIITNL